MEDFDLEKILDNMGVPKGVSSKNIDNIEIDLKYKYNIKQKLCLREDKQIQIIKFNDELMIDNDTKMSFYPKGTLVKSKGSYKNVILANHNGEIPKTRKTNDPALAPLCFEQQLVILEEGILTVGIRNQDLSSLDPLNIYRKTDGIAAVKLEPFHPEQKTTNLRYYKCLSFDGHHDNWLNSENVVVSRKHLILYVFTAAELTKNFISTFIFEEMIDKEHADTELYQLEKIDYSKHIHLLDNHINVNKEEDALTKANK
jgi:hypothetical protein